MQKNDMTFLPNFLLIKLICTKFYFQVFIYFVCISWSPFFLHSISLHTISIYFTNIQLHNIDLYYYFHLSLFFQSYYSSYFLPVDAVQCGTSDRLVANRQKRYNESGQRRRQFSSGRSKRYRTSTIESSTSRIGRA